MESSFASPCTITLNGKDDFHSVYAMRPAWGIVH